MRSNTFLRNSHKRTSSLMWSVSLSVLTLMMVISVAHAARANEQQCKKREHEVIIGDLLFAFPAGKVSGELVYKLPKYYKLIVSEYIKRIKEQNQENAQRHR